MTRALFVGGTVDNSELDRSHPIDPHRFTVSRLRPRAQFSFLRS